MTPDIQQGGGLPGTRPPGARDETDARWRVREMFSRIAPRYDFLNHFLSASFDKLWRGRAAVRVAHILVRPDARVLDLCCGTGDLAFTFDRRARRAAAGSADSSASGGRRIYGADFALPMLSLAQKKRKGSRSRTDFLAGDALQLPFADGTFDLVASAFGFRNLANYSAGLREIVRVLKPGGELAILEFCEPRSSVLATLYRFYFTRILPRLGGAISGSADAYAYLPGSVRKFPPPEELRRLMAEAGFRGVNFERWTCGIVAFHRGRKP